MKKITEFVHFKSDAPLLPPTPTKQFHLIDPENYFESFRGFDNRAILEKYTSLIFEYLLFFFDKIKYAKKRQTYFKYIFERGFDTVTSVFTGMLLNTKNVDLSLYHGQKSLYFYIEFIEQISDAQNSFLQLSSRDAVMFVYKRTIFELNKDMVKTPTNTNANANAITMTLLNTYAGLIKGYAALFVASADDCIPSINEYIVNMRAVVNEILKCPLNEPDALQTLSETLLPTIINASTHGTAFWEKNKQIIIPFSK
jgi:hypothetical protein